MLRVNVMLQLRQFFSLLVRHIIPSEKKKKKKESINFNPELPYSTNFCNGFVYKYKVNSFPIITPTSIFFSFLFYSAGAIIESS